MFGLHVKIWSGIRWLHHAVTWESCSSVCVCVICSGCRGWAAGLLLCQFSTAAADYQWSSGLEIRQRAAPRAAAAETCLCPGRTDCGAAAGHTSTRPISWNPVLFDRPAPGTGASPSPLIFLFAFHPGTLDTTLWFCLLFCHLVTVCVKPFQSKINRLWVSFVAQIIIEIIILSFPLPVGHCLEDMVCIIMFAYIKIHLQWPE